MEVSTRQAIDQALKAMDTTGTQAAVQQQLQVAMLKKTLEAQKAQAAEITRMVEGKGRIIDIRV